MSQPTRAIQQACYDRYFRFNNMRTLSTAQPSALRLVRRPGVSAFVDGTRRYDNQVLIHQANANGSIAEVIALYAETHSPEISIEPDAMSLSLSHSLSAHGYLPSYALEFLALETAHYQVPARLAALNVEMWDNSHADAFLQLLKTSGLACDDAIWAIKRRYYCTETFRCFVAFIDDVPRAWATSFIEGDCAIFANAFTQEPSRRHGCQSALLHARINDAKALGVAHLFTDVMPHSVSSKNCRAAGFSTLTHRTVWEKYV
ncbi:N-acetyltransferase [Celerinatantimonas yamalensis]|uniref:N-acetyltransferase n=1 Tax=Celerinatantimonas yamalensis TaxID=559956 RepID=A0ABW9GB08_9GAMM